MTEFIEIGSLTVGAIYRLRARNIVFGVYLGEGALRRHQVEVRQPLPRRRAGVDDERAPRDCAGRRASRRAGSDRPAENRTRHGVREVQTRRDFRQWRNDRNLDPRGRHRTLQGAGGRRGARRLALQRVEQGDVRGARPIRPGMGGGTVRGRLHPVRFELALIIADYKAGSSGAKLARQYGLPERTMSDIIPKALRDQRRQEALETKAERSRMAAARWRANNPEAYRVVMRKWRIKEYGSDRRGVRGEVGGSGRHLRSLRVASRTGRPAGSGSQSPHVS